VVAHHPGQAADIRGGFQTVFRAIAGRTASALKPRVGPSTKATAATSLMQLTQVCPRPLAINQGAVLFLSNASLANTTRTRVLHLSLLFGFFFFFENYRCSLCFELFRESVG
jgi:hypothetical protein